MAIIWYNEKPKNGVATFYDSNITLNKATLDPFETAYMVMIGIDYDNSLVIIKPLSKDQAMRGDISEKQMYRITVRTSYGRISNKEFMNEIQMLKKINLKDSPKKFTTTWDDNRRYLVIDLNKEEL